MNRLLLVAPILLSGCMKTYVKRVGDLPVDPAMDTLMVSAMVKTQEESNNTSTGISLGDVVEAVGDGIANSKLDTFGDDVVDSLTPFLESQGFHLVMDEAQAKSLQNRDWSDLGNSLTTLTGGYTDPRGASLWVAPNTLFRKRMLTRTVEALGTSDDAAIAFLTVTIYESRHWLVMRYPKIQATMIVSDHTGREVLRAQGIGEGNQVFLFIDRAPDNLQRGMDQAVQNLGAAEVQVLE